MKKIDFIRFLYTMLLFIEGRGKGVPLFCFKFAICSFYFPVLFPFGKYVLKLLLCLLILLTDVL